MMRMLIAAFGSVLLSASTAAAQTAAQALPPLSQRLWIVAGAGFSAARAGCPSCPEDGVYANSYSFLVDAGISVNPRVDVGIELMWVSLDVGDSSNVKTTFILGVAQFRPWVERGFFLRAGMGLGIAGNGLYNPDGPPLAPPYTTNALGIAYGAGWEVKVHRRWGLQIHGMHHVAAMGELTTIDGNSIKNVVGNYWTVGAAIVFR